MTEPLWLSQRRSACALSADHGLGALKYLLDPLRVDIIRHRYVGVNFVTLRRGRQKAKEFKLYTCSRTHRDHGNFTVTNFMYDGAPEQYLFLAFSPEPVLWTATRDHLLHCFDRLLSSPLLPYPETCITRIYEDNVMAENKIRVRPGLGHPWHVTTHRDLGF